MIDYLQPGFYRFNQDSLELVEWVKEKVRTAQSILDLGAGCGVIGLELAQFYRPKTLTLLELQAYFLPYLEANLERFLPDDCEDHTVFASFKQWDPAEQFDLIVCNPPYYLPQTGQTSPDPRRALARSFIQDNWCDLLNAIERSLAKEGKAFLVVKNEKNILKAIEEASKNLQLQFSFNPVKDLMMMELVRLHKN